MKKQPKKTRWFNIQSDGQPVREGAYQVRYTPSDKYPETRYWNGVEWCINASGFEALFGNYIEDHAQESWRGLTAEAAA